MSYGATQFEIYTMAAEQVAKILDGARPSERPLRQTTRFKLVINLRTAKSLGLTIPQSLLLRADEVTSVVRRPSGPETHEGPGSLDPSPSS
jgi:ABC-type uncharacterized transport system substrate-binding protein